MIEFTPPFYLLGEAAKTLDATPRLLKVLGITNPVLNLVSMGISTLTFSIPKFMLAYLPDQEQQIELRDSATPTPRVLFKGRVTRTFDLKSQVYTFKAEDAWKRLSNAPLKGASTDRPYRIYPTQSVQTTLASIIGLATADNLPVQTPSSWPTLYSVPKMALRTLSYADAVCTVLKYVPDAGTTFDYSANPPRLKITRRAAAQVINTDVAGHGVEGATLRPEPALKALGITIHYAERTSLNTFTPATQTAGNIAAEADRQISLMLSGFEKTDGSALDSLTAALQAYDQALTSLSEVAAGIDQIASSASIAISYDGIKTLDPKIAQARQVRELFLRPVTYTSFSYYSYYYSGSVAFPSPDRTITTLPLKLRDGVGNVVTGWYPIKPNTFTDDHLTRAGATKQTLYIRGDLSESSFREPISATNDPGMAKLIELAGSAVRSFSGYGQTQFGGTSGTGNPSTVEFFYFYAVDLTVTAINKSPSQVASLVKASIGADVVDLADGADFVAPPAGLATNYFNAQNWIPMTGQITFLPDAAWKPAAGDHIQFTGSKVDPEWATAEASVASVSLDLHTGVLTAQAGFPARKSLGSLMDALRVPPEDNFV